VSVEDLMASGDSGRTWFPELVDECGHRGGPT
jgi:hypothetical protein